MFEIGDVVKSNRANGEEYRILQTNNPTKGFPILALNLRYGHVQRFTLEGYISRKNPHSAENLIPNKKKAEDEKQTN